MIRKLILSIAALTCAAAFAQTPPTYVAGAGTEPVFAPLRSNYYPLDAADHMIDRRDLAPCPDGQIMKSATIATNPPYTSATEWECDDDETGGGGGGGLSTVATDATIDGDGSTGNPLGIADDAVTQAKLANNSVHAAQIGANAVGSSEIASGAVGSSEIEAGAVTEANMAANSVGHEQLTSNSVRVDEIQANAVGHAEMQDAAVGVVELRDDAAERLCPDPGTGTSGQVCARNAAGDAYELVTQSGGGGGGTDDQTAAEVPVTATGFSGNLSGTDTDVQTALATIDGFTLGGGGGGTPGTSSRSPSRTLTTSPARPRR